MNHIPRRHGGLEDRLCSGTTVRLFDCAEENVAVCRLTFRHRLQ
jgi:hypothetical protein